MLVYNIMANTPSSGKRESMLILPGAVISGADM